MITDNFADFPWPPLPGSPDRPVWTGRGFRVGGARAPFLRYGQSQDHWDDSLTRLHEDAAGPDHFIDRASRAHALGELRRFLKTPSPVILEVGCSSGFLLPLLQSHFPGALVIGSDSFPQALERISERDPSLALAQLDLTACPFPENCVDAVVLLNVLEHIEDDGKALSETHRVLKPGGIAVVEVPAGPGLYDIYDELLKHQRRYALQPLRSRAAALGFEVLQASHLGFFLYLPFAWVKKRNRRLSRAEAEAKQLRVAGQISRSRRNRPMDWVMGMELALGRWVSFPFGIRCLLTLRKAGGM